MATNADNVLVALTGAALVGSIGSAAAPSDASAAWGSNWTDLGYLNEDGITESPEDETSEIKAFQNGDVVREMITGSKTTYQFTLLETTKAGLELYYKGSTVSGTIGANKISITNPKGDKRCFGFDVIDGSSIVRIYIASGEVTERGEITYENGEAVSYEVTVTAYPDSGGVHTIKYLNALGVGS